MIEVNEFCILLLFCCGHCAFAFLSIGMWKIQKNKNYQFCNFGDSIHDIGIAFEFQTN